MKIVLLPQPQGDIIAREEQFGECEGEFYLEEGRVHYRHAGDERAWLVNADQQSFKSCVDAWNRYNIAVSGTTDEAEQMGHVLKLKAELEDAGASLDQEECFWSVLVEQAEDGLL